MRAALTLALAAFSLVVNATHLIGGELYYTSTGDGQYDITLKVYRDCNPNTNTNNQGFDPTVEIAAYLPGGLYFGSISIPLGIVTDVPAVVNDPCLTPPPEICVEVGEYNGTFTLPSGMGGYTLTYQRCCRSPIVQNLALPNEQGLTCTVTVPDTDDTGPNSSPRFTQLPPIALCLGEDIVIPHPATDPDGDVLTFDLAAPYTGGSTFQPIPAPPTAPPYTNVTWEPGYSVTNMIDAAPALAVDASIGTVTLTPTLQGSYVVGLRVREWRNGVQLSEVIRDVRFDVVICQDVVTAELTSQADLIAGGFPNTGRCDGLTVTMENQSQGGIDYHWDFGVPGTNSDTSDLAEPTFTYPQAGIYTVTLIANPSWACADTSIAVFDVAPPVTVDLVAPAVTCFDEQPLTLTASGSFSPAASVAWDLAPGVAPDADQATTHPAYPDNGSYPVEVTVTEFGCTGSFADSVHIHPRPVVMFTSDTAGCLPLDVPFTNLSSAWTPLTFAWSFGENGAGSDEEAPTYTYTTEGNHSVSLTATTHTGCIGSVTLTRDDLVQVWPQPVARFNARPPVVDLMDPRIQVNDVSIDTYLWDFEVNGEHFDTTDFGYTFPDAGWYTITLIATSGLGCADTAHVPVFVGGHFFYAPTAFTPDGDGLNETWRPAVKGARKYKLDIFDRWGNNVFSSEDPSEPWAPTDPTIGTYVYKAWLTEWGPLEKEYRGSFTLFR